MKKSKCILLGDCTKAGSGSYHWLTSDGAEAFLRVVFHADDGFLGVFFGALYNVNYTPGLAH